ncbi:hypothetical protein SLE2022_058710 [Rubroshorea leprosula]
MASENYVQPSIPRFDGHHYDHWSMLMENFLRSKEYWTIVEAGVPEPAAGANDAQRVEIEKEKLKDLKAKNYLFQAIDRAILETILNKSTSKNIWDSMKKKYQGNERARQQQRQALRAEFEVLQMQIGESVDDYFARTMAIANKMRIHGENLEDVAIVEKILRSMTTKFNYVVCSIEESNNIEALFLDELQNSLLIHERKINRQDKQEQANINYQAADNISKSVGKANIECFRCHKYNHYRSECRANLNRGETSNFAEHNEKNDDSSLFMVFHPKEVSKQNVWYLDTGCSNHMCGDKSAFSDLDESCQDKVKFGDNSTIVVKGKGKTISNVLYVPDLKSNLLSLGQLQEKGYEILIKDGVCQIRDSKLGLIAKKKMVNGLPHFDSPSEICEICVVSKQHHDSFPKDRSWRAKQVLDLVHFDLCGPINPTSNGGKQYFITFVDDYSCKTWVYFLQTKSKALAAFKNFKVLAENEVGRSVKVLRTDCGGEFNSKEFLDFCESNGIKRQLTTAYTPQQNGVYFENGEDLTVQNSEGQTSTDLEVSRQTVEESLPTTPELEFGTSSRPQRKKRRPAWLEDYEVTDLTQDDVPVNHFALFVDCDPLTYEEAVKEEKWQKAMAEEIGSIERNQTWELTNLPKGHKTIGVKWIYKTKLKENGAVDKFKAHLVAKGYKQEFGIDYQEVFAPVARMDTIRLVIALAAQNSWSIYQLDVKSAFFHGNLQEQVFIDQPPGYVKSGFEHKVYRLKKALYGLKQAPRAWYSRIDAYFLKEGFQKYPYEYTLYIKFGDGGKLIIVCLYVDDLIYTGNDFGMLEKFKQSMKLEFEMTDLGLLHYFLVDKGVKLVKDPEGRSVDSKLYKQIVGSLMYLTATRPDIMHGVSLISRYMEHPKELHLQTAKRILRYLCGTADFGKSTSRFVFMMGSGAISWSSKKQPIVTLSTTEAEYVVATSCACQAIWLRRIMEELELNQHEATSIYCDNSSAIKLSKNPVLHGRSKHIHVRTEDQVADIFTKPLKVAVFSKLRELLGVCNMQNSV